MTNPIKRVIINHRRLTHLTTGKMPRDARSLANHVKAF